MDSDHGLTMKKDLPWNDSKHGHWCLNLWPPNCCFLYISIPRVQKPVRLVSKGLAPIGS